MKHHPFIHIVIPAYNEEALIHDSLTTLDTYLQESAFPYPYVITVVSNGSTDCTDELVRTVARERSTVALQVITEKGKGRAVREGWKNKGDILAFMDADLSSNLKSFRNLIDAIVLGDAAVATGNRLGQNSHIEGRRFTRELASRAYNFLVRMVFRSPIADHQCGFKAIRREAYERVAPYLVSDSWFFDTELLVLALNNGYRVHAEDIYWNDHRKSKVSVISTSWEMLWAILAFRDRLSAMQHKPGMVGIILQVMRFVISGCTAALLNLSLFYVLFTLAHVHYLTAVVLASIATFITSFLLQKFWTFGTSGARGTFGRQFALYVLSAGATVIMNLFLIYVLVQQVGLPPLLGQFFSLAAIAVLNFFIYKFLIFKR